MPRISKIKKCFYQIRSIVLSCSHRSTVALLLFSQKRDGRESRGNDRKKLSPPCCLRRDARTGQQRYRFASANFLPRNWRFLDSSFRPFFHPLFPPRYSLFLSVSLRFQSDFLPAKARTNAFGEPACASTEIRATVVGLKGQRYADQLLRNWLVTTELPVRYR